MRIFEEDERRGCNPIKIPSSLNSYITKILRFMTTFDHIQIKKRKNEKKEHIRKKKNIEK